MRNRIAALLIAGLAVTGAMSTAGVASAKHGADDPAGHVRQSQGVDNAVGSGAGISKSSGKTTASARRNGRRPGQHI